MACVTLQLAIDLIAEQFPQWSHLPIKPVEFGGSDNRTFYLGKEMSIRLPSAESYAAQVQKEQKWLPFLAPHLSVRIPKPLAMGNPSKKYPWHWSVYQWIDGKSANTLSIHNLNLNSIAKSLAQFLSELHKIEAVNGPVPGLHNYHRGDSPQVYDVETRKLIFQLQNFIDKNAATAVWEKAISSEWNRKPVWIHGDFASGNMLIKGNELSAIIDFGCMAVGDPACDLVIAWTFLDKELRNLFKSSLNLDSDTWNRARGWALWKALFELEKFEDKSAENALQQLEIVHEILFSFTSRS